MQLATHTQIPQQLGKNTRVNFCFYLRNKQKEQSYCRNFRYLSSRIMQYVVGLRLMYIDYEKESEGERVNSETLRIEKRII